MISVLTKLLNVFHWKMWLICLIYLLLQLHVIHNKEATCGCNVDRSQTVKNSVSLMGSSQTQEKCSLSDENEINNCQKSVEANIMVLIPSGEYDLGTDDIIIEQDAEGPKKEVQLNSFYLDKYEVSNENYVNFVNETNYTTETESFGDSFVFGMFLNRTFKEALKDFRVVQAKWWYKVQGADWKHPYGPDSEIIG